MHCSVSGLFIPPQVSLAAMVVFSYASLLPAGLFGYLWWAGAGTVGSTITFVELVCLYGYSLTIYIPVSLLWLVPVCFILIHPCLIVLLDRSPGGSGSVSSWALASPGLSSSPRSGRRSGTRPPSPPWSSWPSSSPSISSWLSASCSTSSTFPREPEVTITTTTH